MPIFSGRSKYGIPLFSGCVGGIFFGFVGVAGWVILDLLSKLNR